MTDNISTSFRNMGFNVLSNSENEYFEEQYQQNNNPNLSIGDSLVLAATSNKLLSSNNGTAVSADLTSAATAAGLLNTITGVAIGDNLTVAVGTNQGAITTAPIIYSANGLNFSKSTFVANYPANVVYYNKSQNVFYVGNTTIDGTANSAITYVPPTGQGMALAAGASGLFNAVAGNRCRAFCSTANGVSTDPMTFIGGATTAGAAPTLGFSNTVNLAAATEFNDNTNPSNSTAGSVNAISCDDGLSDSTNYYVLAGGAFAVGAPFTGTSNLLYTSVTLNTNPAQGQVFVSAATAAAIFPAGVGASSVNAIAFNGSVFLVGGLGTNGTTNVPVVAISTFAAGAFSFAIPTGCNIASLMSNVNSLVWNGTYWIAGGTSANGLVLAKSLDGATWSYISGAVSGATVASAVASKYSVSSIRLPDFLYGTVTNDIGNIAAAGSLTQDITVPGAAFGDFVLVSSSIDLSGLTVTGYVQAANNVRVVFANNTGGAIDLANATYYARVIKRNF